LKFSFIQDYDVNPALPAGGGRLVQQATPRSPGSKHRDE
jgi:hypothetical protein